MLTAAALVVFVIELQLPAPVPIPGVKLGLANIFTLFAIYRFKPREAFLLVLVRVFLGCLFSGNAMAMIFSYSGALLCMAGMLLLKRILKNDLIWLISVIGAVLHNIGQLFAASAVLGSFAVFGYLPALLISGCISGCFTGIAAQLVINRTHWCENKDK
ncbi:MAG: Gx transporter family protein [Oscillospiraceae bacterium]